MWSNNISGHSLDAESFQQFLVQLLDTDLVAPAKICFEITETAAIVSLMKARHFVLQLKERGCRFALDDFGTGLSSFAYLKNLPVDFVKIDGTFVKDIEDDSLNLAMVRSINEIAKLLGKQTIAEFVENDQILTRLRAMGVDYVQGYGVGRPQPLMQLFAVSGAA
jgi:EAL domain-containing protein (putative c-di-GMP-specific phosphodiesterase class I)